MKSLSGFLEKIFKLTLERNHRAKAEISEAALLEWIGKSTHQPRDFAAQIARGAGLISEIKRSSPSQGPIAPELRPVDVAREYLENGASAISVLTEPSHFGGTTEDLIQVRKAFPAAYLLMKDFVIEPYQIYQARAYGADAVLLIVAMHDEAKLSELYQLAIGQGLSVLVEVHDEDELSTAQRLPANLIGINNRDLKSLKTNLDVSRRLAKLRADDTTLVSESGIDSRAAIDELRSLGFTGFLIGTALMQNKQPGESLRALLEKAK